MKSFLKKNGFSLIEMLVTVGIFASLAVLVGFLVTNSMHASKKSESAYKVRSELENALAVMERSIRGAKRGSVTCSNSSVNFTTETGTTGSFSCNNKILKSGSVNLTGDNIILTECSFICDAKKGVVTVTLKAQAKEAAGTEGTTVSVSQRIVLRNYGF